MRILVSALWDTILSRTLMWDGVPFGMGLICDQLSLRIPAHVFQVVHSSYRNGHLDKKSLETRYAIALAFASFQLLWLFAGQHSAALLKTRVALATWRNFSYGLGQDFKSLHPMDLTSWLFGVIEPSSTFLTHYRPAIPFGTRKNNIRGSFQFLIVLI